MNSWIIENLGLTLLHSLWQISFVTAILFVALRVLRESAANFRYLASISALILSLILPVVTFVYLSNSTPNVVVKPITQTLPSASIEQPLKNPTTKSIQQSPHSSPIISENIAVTSPSSNIPFLPILVGFWLLGILFCSIRLAGGIWTVHLYKTRKVSAVEAHWQTKFDELCESLQIRQKVKFLQSQIVEMPMVIGWLKPVVLVPASAFLQISPKELETILIHELTHIKRRDYLVNFVQTLVEILFFFHPCVWWISANIRTEREFAVDEFIAQTFETERFIYATALANLEESRTVAPILAMGADGGNLMKRIEKILNGSRKINSKNVSIWSAVFVVTFVVGLSVGVYWLKMAEAKSLSKKGRKIAVIFTDFSEKKQPDISYQNLVELQNKFNIPATWVLDSDLIETLRQNDSAQSFFRQAKENRSEFIVNVPNISYTIFINGDDEYIEKWKNRINFVEENMQTNGDKLKYYSINYKSQIPQEMEKVLTQKGLKQKGVPYLFSSGFEFTFDYEKDCDYGEGKMSCKEQNPEKQKEIREKYIQYINEIFEFNENYSNEKFGVVMPQVLTLRNSKLTKDSADELLQMLQDNGYEFVPFEEVTSNEIFTKLEKGAGEHRDFYLKKYEILDKYWDRKLLPRKPYPRDTPKNFNVNVTTKDLKPKP